MLQTVKKDIRFNSADGTNKVAGYFYTSPTIEPFCVLQISHGMCEHINRYAEFATFLNENGVAVCGNDHLGHGKTAQNPDDFGYFAPQNGRRYALLDLKTMNQKAHEEFPGLPVVLLGHSMGSFFARKYAQDFPETINGLIISGTGGPNPLAGIGIALCSLLAKSKGDRYRSELVHKMAFGSYLRRFNDVRTDYDWISRDREIVDIYAADPACTFRFTVNGFHELFSALRDVSSPEWAADLSKTMPILMFSGDMDPVGGYGKGTNTVYKWLKEAEIKNVSYKLYSGGRHEMLNETNRQEVYGDVLKFLKIWWAEE